MIDSSTLKCRQCLMADSQSNIGGFRKNFNYSRTGINNGYGGRLGRRSSQRHHNSINMMESIGAEDHTKSKAIEPFFDFSGFVESEYLSMIDQIIVACDASLNVLYNNYQERLYERIVLPIRDSINCNKIRMRHGCKLDAIFSDKRENFDGMSPRFGVESDSKTIQNMITLISEFELEQRPENISKIFPSREGLKVVHFLLNYYKKARKAIENTPKVRMEVEKKRNEYSGQDLVVGDYNYLGVRFLYQRFLWVHQRIHEFVSRVQPALNPHCPQILPGQ